MRSHFTSVVNSMDVVPRLSVGNLRHLQHEIVQCAESSKDDISQDIQDYVERASTVWAPKVRKGQAPPQASSPQTSPQISPKTSSPRLEPLGNQAAAGCLVPAE